MIGGTSLNRAKLGEFDLEAHVEGPLEDKLRLLLQFCHSEECHPQQVLLGALEHDPVPRHAGRVVAIDELEVGQHPRLSVVLLSVKF